MEETNSLNEVFINELLVQVIEADCSDLYLDVGRPPRMSKRGTNKVVELAGYEVARPAHIQRMVYDILSNEQITAFENELSLLFTYAIPGVANFGVLVMRDSENVAATFHLVPLNTHDTV